MKRLWKISEVVSPRAAHWSGRPVPLRPHIFTLTGPSSHAFTPELPPSDAAAAAAASTTLATTLRGFIDLFTDKLSGASVTLGDLQEEISEVKDALVRAHGNPEVFDAALSEKAEPLLRKSAADGSAAFIELLRQLHPSPRVALEVFMWRRELAENGFPLTSEEYAKGIKFAGRAKDVSLAVDLFNEAAENRLKTTSTYNALMAAYMCNWLPSNCQEVFRDLKKDPSCTPTIVTFNILISVFGGMMLVDHMETTYQEIEILNLSPDQRTYNNLIAGYVTAWMWDSMEKTFLKMKASSIRPNVRTYSLLLRGYAYSCDLEKMEQMYELVKHEDTGKIVPLIRVMIRAYCKSTVSNRVQRIHDLSRLVPEEQFHPWLNVLLIRLYAQEDQLVEMEYYINKAFERNISVQTTSIMKPITASYFRCNAVDKLADFVRRAESAGWKLCRSLYHCQMVMYALENRLKEMENVVKDMERFQFNCTRKTLAILINAYSTNSQERKVKQVLGLMCKHGYGLPLNALAS